MLIRFHLLSLLRLTVLATMTGLLGLLAPSAEAATHAPTALAETSGMAGPGLAAMALAPQLEGTLNLNTATPEQLELLPGVGPATAAKILAYREQRPFKDIRQLMRIKGIGRKRFEAMRPHLTVEGETTLHVAGP